MAKRFMKKKIFSRLDILKVKIFCNAVLFIRVCYILKRVHKNSWKCRSILVLYLIRSTRPFHQCNPKVNLLINSNLSAFCRHFSCSVCSPLPSCLLHSCVMIVPRTVSWAIFPPEVCTLPCFCLFSFSDLSLHLYQRLPTPPVPPSLVPENEKFMFIYC